MQNGQVNDKMAMKAMLYSRYGTPDGLKLKDIEKPLPKENEVLIKVHAVSLNASDWEMLTGKPYYTRIWGLRSPKFRILGSDVAGTVEAVGDKVMLFKPGDEVFGDLLESWGGLAEYVCAREDKVILKPHFLSFSEAAALPQAAVVALQGLQYKGALKRGDKVLIIGAGGGAGSFAVQIAHLSGAEVTGVDHSGKFETMLSLGATHVIDYTQEDYTQRDIKYDLILDIVGKRPFFDFKNLLNKDGGYAMVGGSVKHLLQSAVLGPFLSKKGIKKMGLLVHKQNRKDINYIVQLIKEGKIKPVIDKEYILDQAPEAFRHLGEGRAIGKIIIKMPILT